MSSKESASAGSRRRSRETALQVLYLTDLCHEPIDAIPEAAWSEEPLPSKIRTFALHLMRGVYQHQVDIDPMILKYTENWELGRMATIDRCILRIATFELVHDVDTPVNVIINEAVEIAKRYSTAESSKFVNGILDKIKTERK